MYFFYKLAECTSSTMFAKFIPGQPRFPHDAQALPDIKTSGVLVTTKL